MNTTTNPSQRTEQVLRLTAGTEPQSRDHASRVDAAYKTPDGAKQRTFELTVDSSFEMWLLTTFTGHAGERLWVSSFLPFQPIEMKLTYQQGTLELPEVRWLVDRIFDFNLGSKTLHSAAGDVPSETARTPRPQVLAELAEQVHKYLDAYDVAALVKYVSTAVDRSYFDVAARAVPSPSEDLAAFELHLLRCMDCIRLTYIDDSFLR